MTIFTKLLIVFATCLFTQVHAESGKATHGTSEDGLLGKFKSNGNHIILFDDRIDINSREFGVHDCSNGEYFCYKSEVLDFFVQFPKHCKFMDWFRDENNKMEVLSIIPHTPISLYYFNESRKFLYQYSDSDGLLAIYYDNGKELFNEDDLVNDSVDFDHIDQLEFRKVSEGHVFQCR